MKPFQIPHYELFWKNGFRWGRLLSNYTIKTPITGYNRILDTGNFRCILRADGELTVVNLSEWDFGTGPGVIQDIAMVPASLVHDAFCHLTDRGILPWSVRMKADNYFASMLWRYGSKGFVSKASTSWRWLAVTANSQLIARWRR